MKIKKILTVILILGILGTSTLTTEAVANDIYGKVGEINLDGTISIADVTLLQKSLVGLEKLSLDLNNTYEFGIADANNDGKISIGDATEIQKFLVGFESEHIKNAVWHETVYETVDHPAETKQIWVVDREAGIYDVPLYENIYGTWCWNYGHNMTVMDGDESSEHVFEEIMDNAAYCNWITTSRWVDVSTGLATLRTAYEDHQMITEVTERFRTAMANGEISSFSSEDVEAELPDIAHDYYVTELAEMMLDYCDMLRQDSKLEISDSLAEKISNIDKWYMGNGQFTDNVTEVFTSLVYYIYDHPEYYPNYKVKHVYYTHCTACHKYDEANTGYVRLMYGPWAYDTESYTLAEQILDEHMAEHRAKGEEYKEKGYLNTLQKGLVLIKSEDLPEEGHWETVVVKEAWKEKILVSEGYWG